MKKASLWLVALLTVLLPLSLAASPANAAVATKAPGHRSLASVLAPEGTTFDRNPNNFNIATHAILAVLKAKPNSPVKVLTDGSTRVTAFVPTDRAFRRLVHSLTGKWIRSERKIFAAVAKLGTNTVEKVLLYHVVPGVTITKRAALKANGATLTTALGSTVKVSVRGRTVRLIDKDPNAANPRIVKFDINKGNLQIAHAINRVLRPATL